MDYPSKVLSKAVEEIAGLPGIGKKSALRLALHLLRQPSSQGIALGSAIQTLVTDIRYCKDCHNFSDSEICDICSDEKRNDELLCIVEDVRDVMAIENTNQFFGVYHVLGGLISPMDGIGPSDLFIDSLVQRVATTPVKEIILALSANMEGDTTLFYLHKRLKDFQIPITTIARGIAFGGELEYADEITLGRSIITRVPYEGSFIK